METTLKSKRNFLFYISQFIIISLCILGSLPLIVKAYEVINENQNKKGLEILIIAATFFVLLACFYIFISFKKVPIIYINDEYLKIRNNQYQWSEIISFNENSKEQFYYWAKSEMNTFTLEVKNSKKIIIFKNLYSNHLEIEKAIKKNYLLKK